MLRGGGGGGGRPLWGGGGGGGGGVGRSLWCGRERDVYGATLFLAAVNRAELLKCHLYF